MKLQIYCNVLIFISFLIALCNAGYRGGSINWVKLKGRNVRFTYRMTWERGTGPCGPGCSTSSLNKTRGLTAPLSALRWSCTTGCGHVVPLHDVNYILTSVGNISSGWEHGEGQFYQNLSGTTNQFEISLDNITWSSTVSGVNTGKLVTTVDLRLRNDTNLPNAGPIAAVQPFIGIPYGCSSEISLPAEDPDADDVRCRLATTSECGGACTNLPQFKLHDENCSVTVVATSENGFKDNMTYRLTVMMEDFPDYNVAVGQDIRNPRHPFSKIPLQVTINVIQSDSGCNVSEAVVFTRPEIPDNKRTPYSGTGVIRFPYYLQAKELSSVGFLESMPAGASYKRLFDDYNRTDVVRAYAQWSPGTEQIGDAFFCLWSIQETGITSTERRCITSYIIDEDNCTSSAIAQCSQNKGWCIDLYLRYTCKCPHGFKPLNCTERITCKDFPCHHNSTCVDTGTLYKCACTPGYTGVDCELELDHPIIFKATGKEDEKVPIWPIVVGTIAAAAALAIAGCCLWWLWGAAAWRRRRQKEKKIYPSPISSRPSSAIATKGSSPLTSRTDMKSEEMSGDETVRATAVNPELKLDGTGEPELSEQKNYDITTD